MRGRSSGQFQNLQKNLQSIYGSKDQIYGDLWQGSESIEGLLLFEGKMENKVKNDRTIKSIEPGRCLRGVVFFCNFLQEFSFINVFISDTWWNNFFFLISIRWRMTLLKRWLLLFWIDLLCYILSYYSHLSPTITWRWNNGLYIHHHIRWNNKTIQLIFNTSVGC